MKVKESCYKEYSITEKELKKALGIKGKINYIYYSLMNKRLDIKIRGD